MKRALKHKSSIYEYLEACGVLINGTDNEIKEARKRYWKNYRASYQKQKRKEQSVFTVAFKTKEMQILLAAVKKHHANCTHYIKLATLAYSQQQFVIPDPNSINLIRELLVKNYTILQNMEEEFPCNYSPELLTQQFSRLEENINQLLTKPKVLENAIRESIKSNPENRQTILKLLDYDH